MTEHRGHINGASLESNLGSVDAAALLAAIYSSTLDFGIFTVDLEGNVTTWNAGAERITGFSPSETLTKAQSLVFTPEDLAKNEPTQEMHIALTAGRAEDYRWHMRKDGTRFWADGVMTTLNDVDGRHIGYLKIFRDITDRHETEAEMYRLAHSDMLTGLPNRYAFEMHALNMIAAASRIEQPMALHLVDLDHFKQVNDTFGHHVGDLLLQQATLRIQKVLRESDFIARLGGDEFALLQSHLPSIEAAANLASKVNAELSRPFEIESNKIHIGGSIGIALCPHDADDLDQLLKKADLALYRAKVEQKSAYHYYTEHLDATAHQRNRLVAALRKAVSNKEFRLEYQPQILFSTGELHGVEALLRCTNPAFDDISIETLIDLAISAGLIKDLSFWVLHEACKQLRVWKDSGWEDLRVCVNLCSEDLTNLETPDIISSILAQTSLHPSSLEVEITERQALQVELHGLTILQTLRAKGINLSLDDFGTGYSALSYLTKLPVTAIKLDMTAIKLDKSFLHDIPGDQQSTAVVKAIMNLSHALGLKIIAEGVETTEQAAFLKANNCTALQGYFVSKPLLAKDMTAWLLNGNQTPH